MKDVYVLGLCRTAVANFGGSLKGFTAPELGAIVIKEALERANVSADDVCEVIMGNVLQAGIGQNAARIAAIKAGIPVKTPATTINKVCGSGLHALSMAVRAIKAGEAQCVVAGGMESMSNAPYISKDMRWGGRMGNLTMTDAMINDGLWDIYNDYHMGITAENVAEKMGITREEQDEFAVASQTKAAKASADGKFKDEIVAVSVPQRKADPIIFDTDEYIKPGTKLEKIAGLRPAFKKDGTVTAANASGINDGAAAYIVVSEDFLKEKGLIAQVKVVSTGSKGVDPSIMGLGPVESVRDALKKANLTLDQIDLIEANEAFAAQSIGVARELGFDMDKVNVNGGAIAIGHPIGASGGRIFASLVYEMQRRKAKYGLATLCIGGGMGEAAIVELV